MLQNINILSNTEKKLLIWWYAKKLGTLLLTDYAWFIFMKQVLLFFWEQNGEAIVKPKKEKTMHHDQYGWLHTKTRLYTNNNARGI